MQDYFYADITVSLNYFKTSKTKMMEIREVEQIPLGEKHS